MAAPNRPVAYVLAATNHGSMIVNRHDHHEAKQGGYGVGYQLLIEWARHMHGWGRVLAFEAQEYVFYALAGNIALNNCWNANARWAALGERDGHMDVPEPDYLQPGSFGSLELRAGKQTEFIGQEVSYAAEDCIRTAVQSIDALALDRVDFIKLDVEGMEMDVLRGARATFQRHQPILLVEVAKSDQAALEGFLQGLGYRTLTNGLGINMLAIHESDPTLKQIPGIWRAYQA